MRINSVMVNQTQQPKQPTAQPEQKIKCLNISFGADPQKVASPFMKAAKRVLLTALAASTATWITCARVIEKAAPDSELVRKTANVMRANGIVDLRVKFLNKNPLVGRNEAMIVIANPSYRYSLGDIKRFFGLRQGILKANNNLSDVYSRAYEGNDIDSAKVWEQVKAPVGELFQKNTSTNPVSKKKSRR